MELVVAPENCLSDLLAVLLAALSVTYSKEAIEVGNKHRTVSILAACSTVSSAGEKKLGLTVEMCAQQQPISRKTACSPVSTAVVIKTEKAGESPRCT